MEEKILEILNDSNHPSKSLIEIGDELNIKSAEDLKALQDTLDNLIKKGTIYYSNKKKKYLLFENSTLLKGKLVIASGGYGFVILGNGKKDVYIKEANLNNAISNDIVILEMIDYEKNEGRVLRVIARDEKNIVGEFYTLDGKHFVHPDRKNIKRDILIPEGMTHGAVDGHKVVVKPSGNLNTREFSGEIIAIIGHKNEVGVDMLSFVYEYGFDPNFNEDVLEELKNIPEIVSNDDIKGRRDLREEVIFTIDGDDTKDIDDAVSLKKLPNGNYLLGVHIADVSNYVKEGGAIDREAYARGTSVYLVNKVVPMLPPQLSNGICSLNPNTDRLAMSCVMEINPHGKVVSSDIFKSVIRSRKQMTYKNVNKILEENIVPEGYEEFADNLRLMKELADILRNMKIARGYIEFESTEAKILVDEKDRPTDIVLRYQGAGENLIEDFMIAANETVAEYNYYRNLPSIYRVHSEPDQIRWRKFIEFINLHGHKIVGKKGKKVTAKFLQDILKQLADCDDAKILNDLAIRTQAKAIYSEENIGHFGLGSNCYAHFTSPIRRYPDLTLHRLIKDYMGTYNSAIIEKWEKALPIIAEHCSVKEQDADNCERDVEKMKKCEYMENHINEEFTGVISGVQEFGIFVELSNTVEGMIRLEDIKDDYYYFDESTYSIVGRKTKKRYSFGDSVSVKVIAASKENMTVDFALSKKELESNEKGKLKRKHK